VARRVLFLATPRSAQEHRLEVAKIDFGRLNEAARRAERPAATGPVRVPRRMALPATVHLLLLSAGFVALLAPILAPWGTLVGGLLVAAGGYGLGVHGATGAMAQRESLRAERLADVLSLAVLHRNDGPAGSPEQPPKRAKAVSARTLAGSRRRARPVGKPDLRAFDGGADALDQPLSGEAGLTEGALG
jgi:hypothetical protein